MAVCERDGASIHYKESGGNGMAVLFVHGGLHDLMEAERFWVTPGVAGAAAAAGYRVLLADRRWAGGATSAPVATHTWQLEAADLAAVLRQASAWPALVVAGSNGCSAAARLALDDPALVAGLVLCWPVAGQALGHDRLAAGFERSAAFLAGAGTQAYLQELRRRGMPQMLEAQPGVAFSAALLRDARARDSFLKLDGAQAAQLVRASARALLGGETLRGATDSELRSLRAAGPAVRVVAPATDDLEHTLAIAERAAALAGAEPPGSGFPETPVAEFEAARGAFTAELLALLGALGQARSR
jgi:pimeloyl-ACP methyl ester carboxylesterase